MIVTVLSDTHLQCDIGAGLGPGVLRAIEESEVVLHAGDHVTRAIFDELSERVTTFAVLGNNDHDLVGVLPLTREFELSGVRIAMIHDSGAKEGRALRMKRRFPSADIVVFGHSHEPCNELGLDGQLLFNPGSPTQRRRQPMYSFGRLNLIDGKVRARAIERF